MDMSGVSNSSNSEVINTVISASRLTGDRCFFPPSYQQQGLWLVEQMSPGYSTYNIPVGCFFRGELDTDALEKALRFVIKKYEIFRTTFGITDGSVSQIIWHDVDFSLPHIEVEEDSFVDPMVSAISLANAIVQQDFDITEGPLFRFALIRIHPSETLLVASFHHIMFDGWSIHPFLCEVSDLYSQITVNHTDASFISADQEKIQYADYAVWQRERLSKDYEAKLINFWQRELEDVNPFLELPSDNHRPAVQAFDGDLVEVNIELDLVQQLNKVARDHKTSLYVVILSALYVLLYKYTKQETILIGSPFADRSLAELENAVGFFARTVVLKGDLTNEPTFSELILRVRDSVLAAQENQDLPFETLVEKLHPARDPAYNPLFQVMFGLQSLSSTPSFGDLESSFVQLCTKTSKFDLYFDLREERDGLKGIVEFATSLFAKNSIIRMVAQYKKTLQALVKNPNQPIWQISILPDEEENKLLVEWNDTCCEFPGDKCLHQLVEAQMTSDKIALVTSEERLTYEELNRRANKLAHYLLNLGVKTEDKVGVCLARNADLVVSLLAVLKAGGAYLALDPAYPKKRNAFTISDSGAQIVLTAQSFRSDFEDSTATLVCIDQERAEIEACSDENVCAAVHSHNLAYVIYTSGSTGKPKGVMVHHQAVVNFLCSMVKKPGLDHEDKLLAITTHSFDISVLELFLPLITGATVVVATREQATNGGDLINIIQQENINVMQATPATWRLLIASGWLGDAKLKALCGGEPLQRDLMKDLLPKISELWNMYGPTEATVWSTCYRITTADRPAFIGKPIDNTQCYVLAKNLQPVPIGVPGELYIGGSGVSKGYLNRDELTTERFVDNPFSNKQHSKLYRTGDLVKYNLEGNLEYIQRTDNQVKVRGFRIELGEIEAVIAELDSITQACVVVREVKVGDPRIYAYIVLTPGNSITPTEVRKSIRQKLPDYMIPQYFIEVDQLPLMPNGKIDKNSLPLPFATQPHEVERIPPRNNKEKFLVKIWADVLDIPLDQISINDNFYEIGGHSLLSIQVISRLSNITKTKINFRDIVLNSLEQIAAKCEFVE